MKYILVTSGVISGIGKGAVSSIGKLLKSNGFEVTTLKIDPCINIYASTFSPYGQGKVFAQDDTEDGLGLGSFERLMDSLMGSLMDMDIKLHQNNKTAGKIDHNVIDIKLHQNNNITAGKVYCDVIDKEREGQFLGKTVQVVPHITDAIQEWIERDALKSVSNDGTEPEICIIELGGTIGDIEVMPFVEAFRQFQFRVKRENFCCVHVSLVPKPNYSGKHKTKPTQASVRELRRLGLSPDIIVCRSEFPIKENVKEKISNFCHVPPKQVVYLCGVQSVYHGFNLTQEQELVKIFHNRLNLHSKGDSEDFHRCSIEGINLSKKTDDLVKEVKFALDGKHTRLVDAYVSDAKTLQYATMQCNLKHNLKVPLQDQAMKYILVTGGVISGIGKGVIASSIGKILKSNGFEVTAIKIDPYINIDAGTFSPYEHGEVFVLDDGGEVDLDLGNYERFMDIKLHRDNNITTGKIFQDVFDKEREGKFGETSLRVVPHITDAIQEWVERVALKPVSNGGTKPEICIIELGGTIGDIESMPFVEAFRQFQLRVKKRENFCHVHVSLVPQPKSTGEHKTKPTQASVRELRGLGLSPDIIVCRSELPINESVKEKISNFCHVSPEQVVCLHDVQSVYSVPILMEEQGLVRFFHNRLNLQRKVGGSEDFRQCSREWRNLSMKIHNLVKEVKIALVGKYTGLEDAYTSVTNALQHASMQCNLKLNLKFIAAADLEKTAKEQDPVRFEEAWQNLRKSDGIIVPGGFGFKGLEGKIAAIEFARKSKKPFLGICLGFQLAVVEFARNHLGWEKAHSYETAKDERSEGGENIKDISDDDRLYVVIEMPEHHTGKMGGTMRLGRKKTIFKTTDSILRELYGKKDMIEERHRHRYEVNKEHVPEMEKAGLRFVGEDENGERLEILELAVTDHPYFVAVQFHPEYISRPLKPSPPYLGLILASSGKLQDYLNKGCQFPRFEVSKL